MKTITLITVLIAVLGILESSVGILSRIHIKIDMFYTLYFIWGIIMVVGLQVNAYFLRIRKGIERASTLEILRAILRTKLDEQDHLPLN